MSYRRGDSSGYAGRLFDHLESRFGRDNVFIDVETIGAGVDFVATLEQAVTSCAVMLPLIGSKWLHPQHDGSRRIDEPGDFVRREIASALESDTPTIPVLVGGARVPGNTGDSAELFLRFSQSGT